VFELAQTIFVVGEKIHIPPSRSTCAFLPPLPTCGGNNKPSPSGKGDHEVVDEESIVGSDHSWWMNFLRAFPSGEPMTSQGRWGPLAVDEEDVSHSRDSLTPAAPTLPLVYRPET